jgi:hypothetical protein
MKFTNGLRQLALAAAVLGLLSSASHAVVVNLSNANTTATFHTEASDGGTLGLNNWTVDGTNHMWQQWFYYRTGSQAREFPVDGTGPLAHVSTTPLDLDGDLADDFVIARYRDTETVTTPETFAIEMRYLLTGGTAGSQNSDMVEVIRIQNLSNQPLDFHLFQYVDFDLNDSFDDDRVVLTGAPINTATQSDPINIIGETVVTPPPQRWEAAISGVILGKLDDGDIDDLDMSVGPIVGDATWSFQWDFTGGFRIPANGVAIISKDKNIRPGEGGIVPEPSSVALISMGAIGGLIALVRRRRKA